MEMLCRKRRIYEHFVCVYLDADLRLLDKKRLVGDTTYGYEASKYYFDPDECIDYITNLQTRKVYLILSASMGEYLVPLIHLLPQILYIYIYIDKNGDQRRYEEIFQPYRMIIRSISNDMTIVSKQMGKDILDSTSYVGIELLKEAKNPSISSRRSSNDIDVLDIRYQQEPEFLYGQLIKEALIQLPSSNDSRKDFIEFCRSKYVDNQIQLKQIDRFNDTYVRNKAFWWYSKDSFVYRLINEALREQNISALYNLRFYLKDLHECISGYHCRFLQTSLNIHSLKVFRGSSIPTEDLLQLKEKIGGLLSINSFLSTSRSLETARSFAFPYVGSPDKVPLLLHIDVDFYHCRTPFADIQHDSELTDEEELLFTMGTVFRIVTMKFNDEWQMWELNLQLTDDQDEKMGYLFLYRKAELFRKSHTPEENLIRLMIHLDQWTISEKIYHEILKTSSMNSHLYQMLGTTYAAKRDYDKAIECYEKALEISEKKELPSIYSDLGEAYLEKDDHSKALSYHQLALELYLQEPIQIEYDLARFYQSIAATHSRARNTDLAIEFFEKSSRLLKSDDPFQAVIYNNMAVLYESIENYEKAIEFGRKTLEINVRILPPTHPNFATIYANLAIALYHNHELKSAVEHIDKACEIQDQNPSADEWITVEYLKWALRIHEEDLASQNE